MTSIYNRRSNVKSDTKDYFFIMSPTSVTPNFENIYALLIDSNFIASQRLK